MSAPVDHAAGLANAVPLPRARGSAERDRHLREASRHCAGTDRAIARTVLATFARYRASGWRREMFHEIMPARLRGRIEGHIWHALKARDRGVSLSTVRRALGHLK